MLLPLIEFGVKYRVGSISVCSFGLLSTEGSMRIAYKVLWQPWEFLVIALLLHGEYQVEMPTLLSEGTTYLIFYVRIC